MSKKKGIYGNHDTICAGLPERFRTWLGVTEMLYTPPLPHTHTHTEKIIPYSVAHNHLNPDYGRAGGRYKNMRGPVL